MDLKRKVGAKLKCLRHLHDLTQNEIAKKTGIAQNQYARYEAGKNLPSIEILIKLADIYETTTDCILDRDNDIEQIIDYIKKFVN